MSGALMGTNGLTHLRAAESLILQSCSGLLIMVVAGFQGRSTGRLSKSSLLLVLIHPFGYKVSDKASPEARNRPHLFFFLLFFFFFVVPGL
jgi:hypothetical protein